VVYPGVVPQAPLIARPINALPPLGVLLSVALLALTSRAIPEPARDWRRGDWLRLAAIVTLLFRALPWLLADLGVYIGDLPILGALFLSRQVTSGAAGPAVHLGHHHGLDGVLLALAALALHSELAWIGTRWLRWTLGAYLALMLTYGLANAVQDCWLEQIVRRGWTAAAVPDVLWPTPTRAWAALLLIAASAWPLVLRFASMGYAPARLGMPAARSMGDAGTGG
jgi:hypothetical protein